MVQTIDAIFDGKVLHLEHPLQLNKGTRVRITIESIDINEAEPPRSFLQTARSLQLQGPSDWSTNLDDYL